MIYIAFDNGTTAHGVGLVTSDGYATIIKLPTKKELSYTKQAKNITRIDVPKLITSLSEAVEAVGGGPVKVGLERPMVNSTRFTASLTAIRALEATLIALETLGYPYEYFDSKQWQRITLPAGIIGSEALKKASLDIGKRKFPQLKITGDADGLLLAEFMRTQDNRRL